MLLVDGGDATYLCHWMRESGLADLLPSLPDTVWVGVSAGSMVMTPRIGERFVEWPSAPDDRTLGVVDFSIFLSLVRVAPYAPQVHSYAPLNVTVTTPRIELRGATDDLLEQLVPLVRAGQADADPPPFDDPMSLYETDPDTRVHKWLQGIWRGRGRVTADFWRLYSVVVVDGQAVGMQDIVGSEFDSFGAVTTFSWLAADLRGRGFGREMREAALHLAFDGFGAVEAGSDAFVDNVGSNRVSEKVGYERNGTTWATRRGQPVLLQRWRITREQWLPRRRDDIAVSGAEACRQAFQPTS